MGQPEPEEKIESLLWRYRSGDAAAFTEIYRRAKPMVRGFLRRALRDERDADEVFQDTFFRLHRYIATYDPSKGGSAWILSIARHAMIKRINSISKRSVEVDFEPEEVAASDDPALAAEIKNLLRELCKDMSATDIELLYQRAFLEATFSEIAEDLEISQPSARQRFSRLMRRLRSST